MNINWHNIRSINGDQKEGFEELIAQLARKEKIPNQYKFIRKGKPDAGVECFWILNDSTEWAWQAKYFTSSLGDSQWAQLDESVTTVIAKHKQIVKFIISIPIDPPDARIDKQKSMLQKWDEHVIKWKSWAKADNLDIEFIPWWHSDLIERLQKSDNTGFILFWFDKENFTDDWFKDRIDLSIANLGNRYTPEINVELDVVKIFNGIARDNIFNKQFHDKLDDLLIHINKITTYSKDKNLSDKISNLISCCDFLSQEYNNIISLEDAYYSFDNVKLKLEEISTTLDNAEKYIDESNNTIDKDKNKRDDDLKNYIRKAYSPLRKFEDFIEHTIVKLFNKPYLLLDGEAGIGKSHLLADIANNRLINNKFSILLLGQHFNNNEDPKKQILNQLDLNCTFDDFLEALNCKGQISGSRIIIFIDAINEGAGKNFWPDHLNGFIRIISKKKWIGLVMSLRSSYVELFEDNIKSLSDLLVRHTHYGFRNVEYEASKLFFKNYNIELPSIPLLHPEFQNPLFLKLFCDGLKKAGHTKIPDGINGITKIFDFFIDSINQRLATPKYFNFSSGVNIVKKAISHLVKYKMDKKLYYVPIEEAVTIVSDIQSKYNIIGNLTDALISEGILSKNLFLKEKDNYVEGIYISYERFEDHLIVSDILGNISAENIIFESKENGLLFDFIKDKFAINKNRGIIEALSIQLPEKYSIELFELIHNSESYEIAEAFVSSLLWRKSNLKIEEHVIEYINNTVLKFKGTNDYFWDTIIAISSNPNHYFNANKTHEILNRISLPERDAWWTQSIHYWYSNEKSLKRLIDWAWSIEDKRHISDESIELASTMLAWFFTSTNRRLRDSATKALICLLENRIQIIHKLLIKFENVNDPYIYERIFAVAYGCTLRSQNSKSLKELSEYIYETIFNKEKVYPHVLLRDYARGIIEYALHLGIELNFEILKIRPPYKSDFPNIPSDEEINKIEVDYNSSEFKDHHWSINAILMSMEVEHTRDGSVAHYGDFGRYVFQSNFHNWVELSPVDLKNIAVKRVFDLGYDVDLHGTFDRQIDKGDRHYHTTERIGKKYQWIAMYELIAQASDNYKMKAPWAWGEDDEKLDFTGPWEPFVRDIDPTIIQKPDKKAILKIENEIKYNNWGVENKEWLKNIADLPDPKKIIEYDSSEWVMLQGHLDLIEDKPLGNEKYSVPRKQIWYLIKSYLVHANDYDNIYSWLSDKNFMGLWMPESHSRYEIFNREYYWSPAYSFFRKNYYEGEEVSDIYDHQNKKLIGKAYVTTDSYSWSAEYDMSKEETFAFLKPCSVLAKGLNLSYGTNDSYMYSKSGELICFDSSIDNSKYPCLYFKKSILTEFIDKNNYKIIWTVLGEKNIVGGYDRNNDGRWPIVSGVYTLINNKMQGSINQY